LEYAYSVIKKRLDFTPQKGKILTALETGSYCVKEL